MYQQYLESKQNDTSMNVPGDNVVTDVIPPGGGGSQYKSDGPAVLPREDVVAELILMVNPLYCIMSVAKQNYEWCLALRSVLGISGVWPK